MDNYIHFENLSVTAGLGIMVLDTSGSILFESTVHSAASGFLDTLYNKLDCKEECHVAFLYACYQARRFGGRYIFFAPSDLVYCAAPLLDNKGKMQAGILAGPFLIDDYDDFTGYYMQNRASLSAADIAEISEGSYVKAIQLHESNHELRNMLHKFEVLFASMSALKNYANHKQINFLLVQDTIASIVETGREEQKNFLRFALRMIRNILMLGSHNESVIKATTEEKKVMNFFTKTITLKNAQSILYECNQALYHIERNGNSTLVFTDFYLKVSRLML